MSVRILLVDDEAAFLDSVTRMLRLERYSEEHDEEPVAKGRKYDAARRQHGKMVDH